MSDYDPELPEVGSCCKFCGGLAGTKTQQKRHYDCKRRVFRTARRRFFGTKDRISGEAVQEHRGAVKVARARDEVL